mmetsp:Transcript_11675/g.31382  ORF Transcript_11675/g.31382 Transcript_11675/m.31382 type:complete len:265 (+) Transcript_11675:1922-2716(+)
MPMLLVVLLHFLDRLCDDVLVLQHGARGVHAGEVPDALGPQARAVHHPAGVDHVRPSAAEQGDLPSAVGPGFEAHHLGVFVDLPAESLRLGGEGLRHGGRINVPVALAVQRPDEAVDVGKRVQALHLLRADDVELRTVEKALIELRLRQGVLRLFQPLFVLEEPHGPRLVEGQRYAILVLPLFVQFDTLLVPELEVVAAVVIRDEARGVPRRPGGERRLLEDRRGGTGTDEPEVVEDGRAGDAAAHDGSVDRAWQVLLATRLVS